MKYVIIAVTFTLLVSCDFNKKQNKVELNSEEYFEGEVKISESRGLYGKLFSVQTAYYISTDRVKREQKLGGVNAVFNNYAGLIIDLETDSVVLYYSDRITSTDIKHSMSVTSYDSLMETNPLMGMPSPFDQTFTLLEDYQLIKQVNDSAQMKGFSCDYTKFEGSSGLLKQEVFDTKEIKIKHELLQRLFPGIPREVNFPLRSETKMTLTEIKNDTLVNNDVTQTLAFLLQSQNAEDSVSSDEAETDLADLASNKWLNKGLNVLKNGIDLSIRIVSELDDFSAKSMDLGDLSLPGGRYTEIDDLDDFLNEIPGPGDMDFDD